MTSIATGRRAWARRSWGVFAAAAVAGVLGSCTSASTADGDIAAAVWGRGTGGVGSEVNPTNWKAGVTIVSITASIKAFNADGTPCPAMITDPGTVQTGQGGCKAGRKIKFTFGPCEPPVKVVITNTTTYSNGMTQTVSDTKTF